MFLSLCFEDEAVGGSPYCLSETPAQIFELVFLIETQARKKRRCVLSLLEWPVAWPFEFGFDIEAHTFIVYPFEGYHSLHVFFSPSFGCNYFFAKIAHRGTKEQSRRAQVTYAKS